MSQSRQKQQEALEALQKAKEELGSIRKEGLSEKDRQELERIRKKQKELEKQARELAKKMDESKKKKASESTRNASKSMSSASQNMSKDNPEEAGEDQERAKKQLDQAKRELEKERNKYEQMRQDRVIFNLIHELRKILESQKKVRTQTVELQEAKGKSGRLAGLQMRRLFKVASGQKKLIGEAEKVGSVLSKEGSVVFSEQMEFASGDMEEIQRRLKQVDLGEGTQQLQKSVETKLVSLIKALKDERQKRQKDEGQQPEGGQGGQMRPQILPKIAELRALRDMEMELQGKTQGLQELFQRIEKSPFSEERKESMRATLRKTVIQVGHRQGKVADLTRKFIEALEGK